VPAVVQFRILGFQPYRSAALLVFVQRKGDTHYALHRFLVPIPYDSAEPYESGNAYRRCCCGYPGLAASRRLRPPCGAQQTHQTRT
jgi:hypothetical protein